MHKRCFEVYFEVKENREEAMCDGKIKAE